MDGGRMLGDRYEIDATLGRGGMATVYRGRDRVLDRPVAIKVLAERYAGDERFVTRFEREARAAAGLSHGNIVSVFDTGQTDGEHFIVMELVEGETLAEVLRREGPLSTERAVRIADGAARALQAAHDRGLVHRDVKPGNVMLTPRGEVKVMDFGIARAASEDRLTQTGLVLGTASYLSPEQSRGDAVDHRSDVYSLGCVLYEMLTGRPPFSGGSPVSVAYKHVNDVPQPPSRLNPSVPPQIDAVVMRALEKDPEARFPSAEALRTALIAEAGTEITEPIVGDTTPLPAATEQLEPARPGRGRWIALVAILGVLVLALVAAVVLTEDRGERGGGGRERAEQTSQPQPTPSDDVGATGAAAQLAEQFEVAVEVGLVSPDVAAKILDQVEKAVDEYEKGEQEKALEHLDKADEEIAKALAEGGIAVPQMAQTLHDAINALRLAMGGEAVEPSPTDGPDEGEEGSSDSGPGNSENAPGRQKKEEDD